jgi:hypothetical protein
VVVVEVVITTMFTLFNMVEWAKIHMWLNILANKGVGKLRACLPALYEAKTSNKTSVHQDLISNPTRGTAFILQRSINNYSKKREYSIQLMLAWLLGCLVAWLLGCLDWFNFHVAIPFSLFLQILPKGCFREPEKSNCRYLYVFWWCRWWVGGGRNRKRFFYTIYDDSNIIKNVQHALDDLEDIAANWLWLGIVVPTARVMANTFDRIMYPLSVN